jgi:5-methyltetrahydrofolate--homocysteine methyltransferase
MADYVEAVKNRVVVYDGAMGTSLQQAGLAPDDFGGDHLEGCNELLSVTRPDVVQAVHASFLEVGVDVIETNTFGAFSVPLTEYGLESRVHELNVAAARLAKEVTDDFSTSDQPRWVAG